MLRIDIVMRTDIQLRELKEKDAAGMYEWMHDEEVGKAFRKKMSAKTMEDVLDFIKHSQNDKDNINLAVCDRNDEYLGTISLKNIDYGKSDAEYAIALRKIAWGCGVGETATKLIIDYAFHELGIGRVYLNVLADNERAIRMYRKCGFIYQTETEEIVEEKDYKIRLFWFAINK